MLQYIIWDWNPEIISLGFLNIRYYGLLFAGGFAIGYYILKHIFAKEGSSIEWLDSLLMYVLAGTVIGARLGHCLFYEPEYYLSHPIEILKVWEGGLASHGAAVGILIALAIYSKKVTKKSMIWALDRLLLVVALAGAMIRLGNLANSEIYGRATDSDFGFVHIHDSNFGHGLNYKGIANFVEYYEIVKEEPVGNKQKATINITYTKAINDEQKAEAISEYRIKPTLKYEVERDGSVPNLYIEDDSNITHNIENGHYVASIPVTVVPKHPTHLYEATFYIITFLFLMFVYKKGGLKRSGLVFGIWCVMVFGSRFFIEIIKENQVAAEVDMLLNKGQKLSIPFVVAGAIAIINSFLPKKNKTIE